MAREAERHVNVELRAANDDGAWLESWLAVTRTRLGVDIDPAEALIASAQQERHLRVRIIIRDGESVGVVVYRIHHPQSGSATFQLVATPPEHARKGAGMAAAVLAEEEMRAEGMRCVYAPASATSGISMYFWIRLGYAPLMRKEWPCQRDGIAWLKRTLIPEG
jgi:RimJ/RimL family protein N-acetyltransferase